MELRQCFNLQDDITHSLYIKLNDNLLIYLLKFTAFSCCSPPPTQTD